MKILTRSEHMSKPKVYIDGQEGTTGLQIYDRLGRREDIELLRIDEETTANIGSIHAQFSTNVVPDLLTLSGEARSRDNEKLEAQAQHMLDCIKTSCEKFGASYTGGMTLAYPGYRISEDNPFVTQVKDACAATGLTPLLGTSGGGSDANHMNRHGITAIPLATGMSKVHSTEEFLLVEHLVQTARLVLALVTR